MQIRQFTDNRTSKMKFFVVIALAAACYADQTAQILKQESNINHGEFSYAYETSNGIAASARGVINQPNSDNAALAIAGEYSYPGEDGKPVKINYVADENGYQPAGDLPTPPPTPDAILRSLAYNAAHPQAEEKYPGRAAPPSVPAPAPPSRFPAPSRAANSFGRKPFGKF